MLAPGESQLLSNDIVRIGQKLAGSVIHIETRTVTIVSELANASSRSWFSEARRGGGFQMHGQQHSGQPNLPPASGEIQDQMAIGQTGSLAGECVGAL